MGSCVEFRANSQGMHSAMQEIALCSGCVGGKERVVEMCVVQLVAYGGGVWVRWRGVGAKGCGCRC